MQLGMIGLGRMGANMVRRLHARRARVRGLRRRPGRRRRRSRRRARRAPPRSTTSSRSSTPPRAVWLMVPARAWSTPTLEPLAPQLATRRHRHRRRQLLLQRRHPPREASSPRDGHPLRRRRHQRRRLGPRARLLPDDRRRARAAVQRLDPIFATLAPGRGAVDAHAGPRAARRHRRARATCTAARAAPATS